MRSEALAAKGFKFAKHFCAAGCGELATHRIVVTLAPPQGYEELSSMAMRPASVRFCTKRSCHLAGCIAMGPEFVQEIMEEAIGREVDPIHTSRLSYTFEELDFARA